MWTTRPTRSPRSSPCWRRWTSAGRWSPPTPCTSSGKPPGTWSRTRAPTTCSPRSRTTNPACTRPWTPWTGRTPPSPTPPPTAVTPRDETRTLQVLPAPEGCFPYAAQAFLIERTIHDPHTGHLRSAAAALGITSRTPERGATPTVIATAARGHWGIEALHHVRDVTMKEDAHRLRAGTAPAVMATFRNTAIAALRLIGFTNTAQGRRWAARDATRPLAALDLTI